jgi:urease gamma subunit
MIHVKATIWGEPDVLPFTRIFDYGSADEEIFFSSAAMIQEKLARKMKINANEALVTYCACVVKSIRAGRPESDIQEDAQKILSADKVMVGVPETLRVITFEAKIDSMPAIKITFKEPIPTSSYMLAG